MFGHDALDLVRIDVESGDEDHVLLAVLDEHEALRVHAPDVAGAQPVAEHDLLGLVGPVPVAAHQLRAEHADLADFVGRAVPRPSSSRMETSVEGIGSPIDPLKSKPDGIDAGGGRGLGQSPGLGEHVAGDLLPARGDHRLHRHAAAERDLAAREKSSDSKPGVCSSALNSVFTPLMKKNLCLLQLRDEAREVARIGDEHVLRAEPREQQAVRGEREDVIQRQRGDDDSLRRPAASAGRIQALACSTFATMLRWVSTAALATPVVPPVYCRKAMSCGPSSARRELQPEPAASALLKRDRAGHAPGGAPACARGAARNSRALPRGNPSRSPIARHQDLLELRLRQHLLQDVREILDDDDGLRAGVLELVLELARRCRAD